MPCLRERGSLREPEGRPAGTTAPRSARSVKHAAGVRAKRRCGGPARNPSEGAMPAGTAPRIYLLQAQQRETSLRRQDLDDGPVHPCPVL